MTEKEYEFESQTQKKMTFSWQSGLEQRSLLNEEIESTNNAMTDYLRKPQKYIPHLATLFIIFYGYLGIHWAWTTHLPIGKESSGGWTAADDHLRRYGLSGAIIFVSLLLGAVTGISVSGIGSGLLHLTKPYKKLKNKLAGLRQKLGMNEAQTREAMHETKNRFNLLWELECIIKQSQEKYSPEFMAEQNLDYYQTKLEHAYVNNNEDLIETIMMDIYELPERLETQWQEFCAEKIRIQKHIEMKDAYWQYLKEEGKEIFPAQDFDTIARQTL